MIIECWEHPKCGLEICQTNIDKHAYIQSQICEVIMGNESKGGWIILCRYCFCDSVRREKKTAKTGNCLYSHLQSIWIKENNISNVSFLETYSKQKYESRTTIDKFHIAQILSSWVRRHACYWITPFISNQQMSTEAKLKHMPSTNIEHTERSEESDKCTRHNA